MIVIDKEKLYDAIEVSEILGYTKITIYTWIKEGKLKAFKIGRSWKISETDLNSFINLNRRKTE